MNLQLSYVSQYFGATIQLSIVAKLDFHDSTCLGHVKMSLINGDDNNYYDGVDRGLYTVPGGGGEQLLFLILQTKQN